MGLDDVGLEILVEKFSDGHCPEAHRFRHFTRAESMEALAYVKQFRNVARSQPDWVRRGAHQQRLDEFALAHDSA